MMKVRNFSIFGSAFATAKLWIRSFYLFFAPTGIAVVLSFAAIGLIRLLIWYADYVYSSVSEKSLLAVFQQLRDCSTAAVCAGSIPEAISLLLKHVKYQGEYFLVLLLGLAILALVVFFMAAFYAGYSRMSLDLILTGESSVVKFLTSFPLAPRMMAATFVYITVLMLPMAFILSLFAIFFWLGSVLSVAWFSWLSINILYLVDAFILPGLFFIVMPIYLLSLRLSWFPFFIVDQQLGVFESLIASFEVTAGNTIRLVIASSLFFLFFIVVFKVGDNWWLRIGLSLTYLFLIFPYQTLFFARAYSSIVDRE